MRSNGRPAAIVIAGATRFPTAALESQVPAVQAQITTPRLSVPAREKLEKLYETETYFSRTV